MGVDYYSMRGNFAKISKIIVNFDTNELCVHLCYPCSRHYLI
jgi:hypothetical protein